MGRVLVLLLVMVSCAAAQRGAPPEVRPLPLGDIVAPWERLVAGAYENRGLAQVERLGNQWVLTVRCDGTHSTYINDTGIDLSKYNKTYVSARYRYVERTALDARCVKGPCAPVRDRRIALERLTAVTATEEDARLMARACESSVR
jgi:hypothetical protein